MTQPAVTNMPHVPSHQQIDGFVPGMRGINMGGVEATVTMAPGVPGMSKNAGGGPPAGAVPYQSFGQQQERRVPPPMDRPKMMAVRKKCLDWLNEYQRATGGKLLPSSDAVPPLLLLLHVLKSAPRGDQNDLLECMQHLTIPMSCSRNVSIEWGRTPFELVPWEVRQIPIGPASLFIEHVGRSIFEDSNYFYDPETKKLHRRSLAEADRPQLAFLPFREPTPAEIETKRRREINPGDMLGRSVSFSEANGGGSVLFNMAPQSDKPVAVVDQNRGPSMTNTASDVGADQIGKHLTPDANVAGIPLVTPGATPAFATRQPTPLPPV